MGRACLPEQLGSLVMYLRLTDEDDNDKEVQT